MTASNSARDRRRGRFMVVVGPDGVGKTTIARALVAQAGVPTAYFHFRPPVFQAMSPGPPETMEPAIDKGSPTGSQILGWARLVRNLLRFWAGFLVRVKPALSAGKLVVGDRWAYGYLVQPSALKFYGPEGLARLMVRLLPQPDQVVSLTAPVDVIRSRKQELTPGEIADELEAWGSLPARDLRSYDTQSPPEEVAARILMGLGT